VSERLHGQRLDLRLDSSLSEIARLAEAVDVFCASHGLSEHTAFQFNLCFDELLTNAILHGFGGAPGHGIYVHLTLTGNWLQGGIVEDSPAYDPWQRGEPDTSVSLEDREIGGLGVHIVRTMMEKVRYARVDGENRITFGKCPDAPNQFQGNPE